MSVSPGTTPLDLCGAPKSAAPVRLNSRQRVWLFAMSENKPFRMAWLDSKRRLVRGLPPEDWVYLRAWWRHGFRVSTLTIHADDRAVLAPYFEAGPWTVNEAGRAYLRTRWAA